MGRHQGKPTPWDANRKVRNFLVAASAASLVLAAAQVIEELSGDKPIIISLPTPVVTATVTATMTTTRTIIAKPATDDLAKTGAKRISGWQSGTGEPTRYPDSTYRYSSQDR